MAIGGQANAQTETPPATHTHKEVAENSFKSKNGYEVLPQCGDWGLGISATSFLNYVGNLANGNTFNNAPTFNSADGPNAFGIGDLGGVAVMGKYIKDARTAYRIRFQANAGSSTLRNFVLKSSPTPDPLNPVFVEDKATTNAHVILLGAGIEKRRGHGRVQGIYGAELILGTAASHTEFEYGNNFTLDFNTPLSTTSFGTGSSANVAVRQHESATGNMWMAGARGFLGVEYFVAPKISLGGELGYTLGFSTRGKGYNTTEQWFSGTNSTVTVTSDTYASSGLRTWGIGLDNINAGINLNFYF
jgi:hypothetical protein